MPEKQPIAAVAGRLFGLLALALVSIFLVDLVAAITAVVGYRLAEPVRTVWSRPQDRWEFLDGEPAAIERRLTFTVDDGTLKASYDLRLPREHALVPELLAGKARARTDLFVGGMLGSVEVDDSVSRPHVESFESTRTLVFGPPEVIFGSVEGEASVHLEARPLTFVGARTKVTRLPPTTELRAHTDEVRVFGDVPSVVAHPPPVDRRADRIVFRAENGGPLTFSVAQGLPNTISTRRRELAAIEVPILGAFLYRFLLAIPALLVWWLLRDRDPAQSDDVRGFRPFALAAFVHLVALTVLAVALDLFFLGGDYTEWITRHLLQDPYPIRSPQVTGAWAIFVLTVLVLWPAIAYRLPRSPAPPSPDQLSPFATRAWGVATTVLGVGTFILLAQRYDSWVDLRHPLLACVALAVLVALLYLILLRIVRWVTDGNGAVLAAVSTLVLMCYALFSRALVGPDQGRFNPAVLLVFGLGALALWCGYALLVRCFLLRLGGWFSKSAVVGSALVLWMLVSAAEVRAPLAQMLTDPRPTGAHVGPWTLFDLAQAFSGLFGWVLFGILLYAMCDASKRRRFLSSPLAFRRLGVVYVLFAFYWSIDRFLYLPVPLLVGGLLAVTVLLPRSRSATVASVATSVRGRAALLRNVTELRRVGQARAALRRVTMGDVGKGTSTYSQAKAKTQALDEQAKGIPAKVAGIAAGRAFFGYLWPGTPWESARRAVLYSSLLSAPFALLFLREVTATQGDFRAPGFLEFLSGGAWTVLQWPVYGLFLGYWYPFIRGDSAVQKALPLFVTIVGPYAVFWALVPPTGGWAPQAFWILQIFLVTMVVTLLTGEYALFRSVDLGWAALIEFRDLRGMVAWVTSVAVAVGASIATVIASGATELIGSLLELTGVLPEGTTTPRAPVR